MGKIGIVIPAYNEERVIQDVLASLPQKIVVAGKTYPCVFIVVNDGSSDHTAVRASKNQAVHLIDHILNSGAGAATRTGMHYALQLGCQFVVTVDADGQHHPDDVKRVAEETVASGLDLIIGSRLQQHEGMPWYRVMGNWGLSTITFLLFGVTVSDSQSGLKGMNRRALEKITYHSDRYAFCSEMLWRASQEKLTIREVPIQAIYTDYSLGKGQGNWGAGFALVGQLLKRRVMDFING